MIGRTLGHFQVEARLGTGGMGEVYRARDRKLGRAVALKILPAEVAGDRERLARFRREARALAALDHPNIVTVFSIEEDSGAPFLTMELVEGHTLGEIIPRRGFGIERFFELAIPLVDSVATAHAAGVVHRDLKPTNVMVGGEGQIKVLDFGLAKAFTSLGGDDSETETAFLTGEGRVIGTVACMSPEQLKGGDADPRSDVFSLGILLYQMATGQSPFDGASPVELMSSILRQEPASATERRLDLPPHLAAILRRCLQKDPEKRYQSARDLRFDLEELRRELAAGEAVASARSVVRPAGRGPGVRWISVTAAAVALAALAGVWLGRQGATPPSEEIPEIQMTLPVVTWLSDEGSARLSPDGEWLAFVSDRGGSPGLWIQRVDGGEAHPMVTDRAVLSLAWSPAGDEIAALVKTGAGNRLEIVPAPLGGEARLRLAAPPAQRLVAWLGGRVFLEDIESLLAFDLDRAEASEIAIEDPGFDFRRHYDVAADLSIAVFSAVRDGQEDLWSVDLASGRTRALTADEAKKTYPHCIDAACRQVLYLSNRTGQADLWILDVARGSSRQLRVPPSVQRIASVSRDGSLAVLRVVSENANLWHFDRREGLHRPLTADSLPDFSPSVAADGSVLAFQRALPANEIASSFLDSRIFFSRSDGPTFSQPRPLGGRGYAPVVAPDGGRIAYFETATTFSPPYRTRLMVGDPATGRTQRVSEISQMGGFWTQPAGLAWLNASWRSRDELVFVEADESLAPRIRAIDLSAPAPVAATLAELPANLQVRDLVALADGRIFYSWQSFEDELWRLSVLVPGAPAETLYTRQREDGNPRLLGHRAGGDDLVVGVGEATPNEAGPIELEAVDAGGRSRRLGRLERGILSTASLSVDGDRVYLTVATGSGLELGAYELSRARLETLTKTDLPGVTYAGIAALRDSVVYSRQQKNSDLWLLRRNPEADRPRT